MFDPTIWLRSALVTVFLAATACGGGGGSSNGPSYSITVSQSSVTFSGVSGGDPLHQSIIVNFVGDGVVVGTLPGQTRPDWLTVSAPAQSASPVTVDISASTLVVPGSYSVTLRFATGKADGTNVVYKDVVVSLQLVAGTWIRANVYGVGSIGVSLNGGALQTLQRDQLKYLGLLATGTDYAVTVPTQPVGQTCTFPDGTTTATGILGIDTLELRLNCNASLIPWTWLGGSKSAGDATVYGTRLTPATGNTPGGRVPSAYAADAVGNLWLFGGGDTQFAAEVRNDLWRYNIATGMWTWMSGSTGVNAPGVYGTLGQEAQANAPGARSAAAAWIDASGNFWLFGGTGYGASAQGMLNDLWMYNASTDMWTWVSGASDVYPAGTYGTTPSVNNIPGGRSFATVAKDPSGAVWLFGGSGLGATPNVIGFMNDLWRFDPSSGVWAWVSGSNALGSISVHGTLGVPDAANHPGQRLGASGWANGTSVWIFGGSSPEGIGLLNEMWRFDIQTGVWTWMQGIDPTNGQVPVGVYNAPGTTNDDVPSGRDFASTWTDKSGNFWLFGGNAVTENPLAASGYVNDLWKYTPASNSWYWISGSNGSNFPAIYGTPGIPSNTNVPSHRKMEATWADPSGTLWLWGGASSAGNLSDVWSFVPQ